MSDVLNFFKDNWRILAECLLVVLSFVVLLIKKKPVLNQFDNILLWVFNKLPSLINDVESIKDGTIKKELVLQSVIKLVKSQFSYNLSDTDLAVVSSYIEAILSTPHKKEV